jgi:hypothetical protein
MRGGYSTPRSSWFSGAGFWKWEEHRSEPDGGYSSLIKGGFIFCFHYAGCVCGAHPSPLGLLVASLLPSPSPFCVPTRHTPPERAVLKGLRQSCDSLVLVSLCHVGPRILRSTWQPDDGSCRWWMRGRRGKWGNREVGPWEERYIRGKYILFPYWCLWDPGFLTKRILPDRSYSWCTTYAAYLAALWPVKCLLRWRVMAYMDRCVPDRPAWNRVLFGWPCADLYENFVLK